MISNGKDLLFLIIVSIVVFIYVAFSFRKSPDPMMRYGLSINAIIAGIMALISFAFAFFTLILFGTLGYIIVVVVLPLGVCKIVKKMTATE